MGRKSGGLFQTDFCLDNYPQEYHLHGYSDLRNPAYQVVNKFGNAVSRLVVKEYIIHNGVPFKPTVCLVFSIRIKKLMQLEVVLYDEIIDLEVHLYYTVI